MLTTLLPKLSFIIGCIVLLLALIYVAGLLIPTLGRHLYRKLWPAGFADTRQRRAAYVAAAASIGTMLCWGGSLITDQLTTSICGWNGRLNMLGFFLQAAAVVCLLVMSRARRYGKLVPEAPRTLDPKVRWLTLLVVAGIVLAPLVFTYIALRSISLEYDTLNSVALASPTEGWAVGSGPGLRGVVYQLVGDRWVKAVDGLPAMLTDLDLTGPGAGWAVSNGDFLLQLQGDQWHQVPSPVSELTNIDMLTVDEGWAVGNRGQIVHYVNGEWHRVPSPTDTSLTDIAMASRDEGWAIGGGSTYSHQPSVLLHYRDGRWALAENPSAEPLLGIAMASATDGWIVGGSRAHPVTSVLLRYQGGRWAPVASPVHIPLNDVQMLANGEGWAIGANRFYVPLGCAEATKSVQLSAIVHYQDGVWAEVASPSTANLDHIAMTAAGEGWAVGWRTILRAVGGRWREAQELQ